MKKMLLIVLSILALSTEIAFASSICSRCGTEYYGATCPYCKGYSLGIQDKYNGTNSSNNCKKGAYEDSSEHNPSTQRKQTVEGRANCYEGYDDARQGKAPKTNEQ